MTLINCPDCGKEVSDKAEACPFCGYPFTVGKKEAQQDWNSTFLDYSKKLQILNNSINENNEF